MAQISIRPANPFDQFDTPDANAARMIANDAPAMIQPRPEVQSTPRVWGDRDAEMMGLYETPQTAPQAAGNPFDQFDAPAATPAPAQTMPSQEAPAAAGDSFANRFGAAPDNRPFLDRVRDATNPVTTGLAQGATFGFADELVGAGLTPIEMVRGVVTGEDAGKGVGSRVSDAYGRAVGKVRELDKAGRDRAPVSSTVGEIVGAVTSAGGLAKQGVTLLNAARPSYPQMIARGAAEGGIYGGVHGAGTGEGTQDRIDKAVKGAGIGAATGAAFGIAGARIANKAAKNATLTSDDLKDAANVVYDAAKDMGVVVRPDRYAGMVNKLFSRLANEGVDPTLHPGVMAAFKRLEELKAEPISFQTLDVLRRVANGAGKSIANRDEARLARIMVEEIDGLMNNLRPADLLSGNGEAAGKLIVQARDLWSRARKSEALEELVERALDRVGANYTAAGFQTAIRQEVKAILTNPNKRRGYSNAEQAMMRSLVRGTSAENVLRQIGKFAPRGVVGATLGGGVGYSVGGPVGAAAVWGIGEGAKRASSAMTQRKLDNLIELVRRGGPRVLERLPAKERTALDAAIVSGEVTLRQLGVPQEAYEAINGMIR